MRWLIALLIVPAMALVPNTALAKKKSRAKVYTGTFKLAGSEGDYVTGNFGRVQLVDNGRRDKLSVHVRRLPKRTTYVYKLQTGTCAANAPAGTDVAGWRYGKLRTSRRGVGSASARSRTFTAQRGVTYRVVVYVGDQVGLCAQLRTNYWRGKVKPTPRTKPRDGGSGTEPGRRQARGEEQPRGQRERARGRGERRNGARPR